MFARDSHVENALNWRLVVGRHKGCPSSHSVDWVFCVTLEDCYAKAEEFEKKYRENGYIMWFAYAEGRNGEGIQIYDYIPYATVSN